MSQNIAEQERGCIAPTYKRAPLLWEHGKEVYLYDSEGTEYLDMAAGIAVNALGYQHAEIEKVLALPGLIHTSNLYYTRPQLHLADHLCRGSFASKVFFCNSGTEANEGAIKFSRKHGGARRRDLIAFSDGFHGRTMGALACTANTRYREPFEPLIGGVHFATYNDLSSVSLNESVAAVVVEPIQGEGGVRPADREFLSGLRQLCDRHGALLIFDEVQCGLGRTGKLWAYQDYGIEPDLLTVAKPLGGGLPIGAILMNQRVANTIEFGDHGSTFGGGPLVTRVAGRVLEIISQPQFLAQVVAVGQLLGEALQRLVADFDLVLEARGRGLMWGLALQEKLPVARLVEAGYSQRLVMLSSGGNTLRLLPPLILQPEHVQQFEERVRLALQEVSLAVA
ncbi:acetylornithine/succinylornithine family transaminase [bacterium]|nr:acetylornithine/succinylornithine family transaminase [bacterium]